MMIGTKKHLFTRIRDILEYSDCTNLLKDIDRIELDLNDKILLEFQSKLISYFRNIHKSPNISQFDLASIELQINAYAAVRILEPTEEINQFFELLEQFPELEEYWDKESYKFDIELFENDLNSMRSKDRVTGRWLAGLWLNDNRFNFNVIKDLNRMGEEGTIAFRMWVNDPFYP